MKSIAQETPFGGTIFCDDIRYELGGKVSLIGIYKGSINIHRPYPVTLPKFGFSITYSERPGESTEDVSLGIYLPGDSDDKPSIKTDIPMQEGRSVTPDPKWSESVEDPLWTANLQFVVEGLVLKEDGRIKVRAYRGDLEVRLGTLLVQYVAPPDQDNTDPN